MWVIPTGTSSSFKKKSGKESQHLVSHPELSSDPPIGSDRKLGCDSCSLELKKKMSYEFRLKTLTKVLKINTKILIYYILTINK